MSELAVYVIPKDQLLRLSLYQARDRQAGSRWRSKIGTRRGYSLGDGRTHVVFICGVGKIKVITMPDWEALAPRFNTGPQ